MNKNKKVIMISLAIISIICITIGVTLAFLSYTKEGVKENTINIGAITFHYNEDSEQGISLDNALPLSDFDGKRQNKYFDFTITSNNNIEATIPYTITARKVSNPSTELDEQYIKVYLTKVNSDNSETQLLLDTYNNLSTEQHNNHDEEVLWSDSVPANTASYTRKYRLRIWIADTLDFSPEKNQDGTYKEENGEYVYPNNNKEFSIKLNVYSEAEAGIRLASGLYNAYDELQYTWQELIDNNLIKVTDGVLSAGTNSNRKTLLSGKLVIDDSVESIGNNAFRECVALNSVTFESGSQLTSIGNNAFSECYYLRNVEIPSSVTSIGTSAFSGCTGLTSIKLPDGLTSIRNFAFYNCPGLTSITIPSSVTSIGEQAFSSTGLTSIVVDSNNTTYDSRNNSNAIIKTSTNELIVGCKNTIIPSSVTSIGELAFYSTGLTSITIPSSVTSIGDSAFNSCRRLVSIEIPSSVTSIGNNAFRECTSLTTVTFANGSRLTSIGGNTFYYCSSLTSITIPSSVTSIGASAFSGCTGLTSIEIPTGVTSIGNDSFYNCTGLTSVTFASGSQLTSIGISTFNGCMGIASMEIPSGVATIGSNAFRGINTIYYSGSATQNSPWGAGQVISNY